MQPFVKAQGLGIALEASHDPEKYEASEVTLASYKELPELPLSQAEEAPESADQFRSSSFLLLLWTFLGENGDLWPQYVVYLLVAIIGGEVGTRDCRDILADHDRLSARRSLSFSSTHPH